MNETLSVVITAELDRYKAGMEAAQKMANDWKGQVEKASKDVDAKFKAAGSAIATGMKTAAAGVAAAGAALIGVAAATEEYRNNQAKLVTAFEAAGSSADQAKTTYNDLYRALGDADKATEAAGHLAKLTTSQQALSEWTTICQGVYATFGDSLPIEGLTEAANETAKTGVVTGTLADALNWAGVQEDAFNEKLAACNSEAEREKLIRETLNGLYDEAAAKFEENNAQVIAQNEAQAKLSETLARVGEAMAPVVTAFTQFAGEALAAVAPYIEQLAADMLPALQSALSATAEILGEIMGFIADHVETLAVIGVTLGIIAAAIGLYNAVAAVKAAMDALQVTTLWGLVAAYAAQAAAMVVAIAPYVLIVAAIAAVVAAIVVCVKHWDEIKAKVKEVWSNIKEATSKAVDNVKNKFNEMKTTAANKVTELKTAAVNKFNEIKSNITEKVTGAVNSVKEKFNTMKSNLSTAVSGALSTVREKFESIRSSISEKINGAKSAVQTAIDKIKGFFNFSWSLPKLKMPTISITGKFSLSPLSVPKFSISWNKLGGVFDKPAIFGYGNSLQGIGEDGAEAVVPLEKNTQWLDKIAEKLAAKQGAAPIVLQVDGKVFAETSINSINAYTRQTGKLALNIV